MVSADIQRIVLLIGLAVVGYLMVLAWNNDYHRPVAIPSVSHAPAVEAPGGAAPASGAVSDVPSAESRPATPNSDVPEPVAAEPTERPRTAAASDDRLIRIDTRTLSVWVDRLGGDIVRVQLPRYPLSVDQPDVPYLLLDNGGGRTYVAQSGLIGRDGPDAGATRPLYSADAAAYDLRASGGTVVLRADVGGARIEKRLSFAADDYVVGVEMTVQNERSTAFEAGLFAQLKRDKGDPFGQTSSRVGPKPYLGAALTTADERYVKLKFEQLDDGPYRHDVKGGWIAILQHYFIGAWVADADLDNRYYGRKRDDGTYVVGFTGPVAQIAPGETGRFGARFYAGPKDQGRLEALAPNLNLTVDYGFLWWLAVPLFRVMQWFHAVLGNWGIAIILLTLLVKVVLYPLSAASYKSMANMRRVAPQIKRLQERYADDRQKLSQEMMALYQKEKMNPLGGCLPMVIQMPVFLSLYWVLFESVELRQSPFFGWIRDLSVMDPYFVLPILMGVSMYFQMQLNPPPPDPMQARVMKFMPIVFTVMFLFFPAGLVLYWLVNNLLSMAQQWLITRQVEGGRSGARA